MKIEVSQFSPQRIKDFKKAVCDFTLWDKLKRKRLLFKSVVYSRQLSQTRNYQRPIY